MSASAPATHSSPPAPSVPPTASDLQRYRQAIHDTLARIESRIDEWLQNDVIDIDAVRSGDMVNLSLPRGGQLVINAQAPLLELWLAARRGGFHFQLQADGSWRDGRGQDEFFALLSTCASEQSGVDLHF